MGLRFEQANEAHVRLLFFPEGKGFHKSNSIIYVNEAGGMCRMWQPNSAILPV